MKVCFVYACIFARARACVRACVRVCVCVLQKVDARLITLSDATLFDLFQSFAECLPEDVGL